jgi:hypothetical protein
MRRRLNYANVTATLALFFAMSGGALAAKHYLINSTKQINPKVLRALKGNAGSAGKEGAPGAPGKEGAPGAPGAPGKEGPRGPSDVYEVELNKSASAAAEETKTLTLANLPAGAYVIYGKALIGPKGTTSANSRCILTAGAEKDESWSFDSTTTTWFHTVDTTLTHTFAATGTVTMACESNGNAWRLLGRESEEANTRIVAIRVNAEHKSAPAEAT